MTKSYEFTGRTTEEAISAGLQELGKDIGDVSVEILVEGSKGLFGLFGSRPAKVKITVTEAEEKKESLFAHMLDEEPAKIEKKEKKAAPKKAEPKPAAEVKAEPEKTEKETVKETAKEAVKEEKPAEAAETLKHEKKEKKERNRKPHAEKVREEAAEEEKPLEPAPQADPETNEGKAQQFLQKVTELMGVKVSVFVSTDEEGNIRVNMMGDSKGILIGRRGETLDALQYLTSLQINKGKNDYTRVTLDTENYRAKREEALIRLANRMANRCQKTGHRVSLEPMNPYERRILHSALQNNTAVTTHSEGEEPNRHVVITLK